MNELEMSAIRQACTDLVARFHVNLDRFEHDVVAALFSEDGVWQHKTGPLRGPSEVKRYLDSKKRLMTMHILSNVVIDIVDSAHATGTAYYTYFSGPSAPVPAPARAPDALGYYQDRFVRTEAGWKFSFRESVKLFDAGAR